MPGYDKPSYRTGGGRSGTSSGRYGTAKKKDSKREKLKEEVGDWEEPVSRKDKFFDLVTRLNQAGVSNARAQLEYMRSVPEDAPRDFLHKLGRAATSNIKGKMAEAGPIFKWPGKPGDTAVELFEEEGAFQKQTKEYVPEPAKKAMAWMRDNLQFLSNVPHMKAGVDVLRAAGSVVEGIGKLPGYVVAGTTVDIASDPSSYASIGKQGMSTVARSSRIISKYGRTAKLTLSATGELKKSQIIDKVLPETIEFAEELAGAKGKAWYPSLPQSIEYAEAMAGSKGKAWYPPRPPASTVRFSNLPFPKPPAGLDAEAAESVARRVGGLKAGPRDVAKSAMANLAANEAAHDVAARRIWELRQAGDKGLEAMGGLGLDVPFTKNTVTLIPGELFKPVGNSAARMIRHLDNMGDKPGLAGFPHQFLMMGRGTVQIFNETLRAAGKIPGVHRAKSAMSGAIIDGEAELRRGVMAITRGWDKAPKIKDPVGIWSKVLGRHDGMLDVHEYVSLALHNPKKYPTDVLPDMVKEKLIEIRTLFDDMGIKETDIGALPEGAWRKNYVPLFSDNTKWQMDKLPDTYKKHGIDTAKNMVGNKYTLGPHKEVRHFDTFDDFYEYGQMLRRSESGSKKKRFGFDLKVKLDIRELMLRRGDTHIRTMEFRKYQNRMLSEMKLDEKYVNDKVFSTMMPKIYEKMTMLFGSAKEAEIASQNVGRELAKSSSMWGAKQKGASKVPMRGISRPDKRRYAELKEAPGVAKLTDKEKVLFYIGRLRAASSFDEVEKVLSGANLGKLDPNMVDDVRNMAGTSRNNYLNSFAEEFEKVKEGEWKGMIVPKSLRQDMERMSSSILGNKEPGNEGLRDMVYAWDWLTDMFKAGVTSIFPAFHFRNHYSNVSQNFLDIGLAAFDARKAEEAARILAGHDVTVGSIGGMRYTTGEIRQLMLEHGIINKADAIFERQGVYGRHVIVDQAPFQVGRTIGGGVENHARAVNFINHLRRGLSPEEAALRTKRFLFDYGALSSHERDIFRRIMPFYTWTKKNVSLQAEMLSKRPGRTVMSYKLDGDERGPSDEMLPDYLDGRFKIRINSGKGTTFVTGLDLPNEAAFELLVEDLGVPLSSINPIISGIAELTTGREFYTGRKIDEPENVRGFKHVLYAMNKIADGAVFPAGAPKEKANWFLRWLEYKEEETKDGRVKYNINGTKAYLLFKSLAFARVYSTTRRMDDMDSWALSFLTGFGVHDIDMTKSEEALFWRRKKAKDEEDRKRGTVGGFWVPVKKRIREEPEGWGLNK